MEGLINADDFIETLSRRGLVIVSAADFEQVVRTKRANLRAAQDAALKKKALTFKEILDGGFFSVKSKNTLKYWCETGRFQPHEFFINEKDGKYYVLTVAVIRLMRYEGKYS